MIVEHELFERRRIELAIFRQLERGRGKTIRLPRGIQSEDIRLRFRRG
jgi:hypothetical protein